MKQLIIITHLFLVILAYTAWLWLDYRIVIVVALMHLVMLEVLNGCPLSFAQFKDQKQKDTRFYEWWMGKLGLKLSGALRRHMRTFMQYVLPFIIIVLSLVFQLVLDVKPLVAL